jgi:nucleoside-diphosphate-sugar epimerase
VRILVTGGSGYLGSAAVAALRARGHEVVTIGRHPGADAAVCDLADADAVHKAVRRVGDCDVVVHLAARAHDFRGLTLDDLLLANTTTTRNLIAALRAEGRTAAVRFVHASSVAVYELLDTGWRLTAEQAPYAASKLQAEQLLHAEPFRSLCVLRFAPIYDRTHLQDVAKRVFLPGTRVKLRLCPPPVHSLCSLERAVHTIVSAAETASPEQELENVADAMPTSQHDLLGWFPGRALPVPTSLLRALSSGIGVCGTKGRKVSRLIDKFIKSSIYPKPDWSVTLAWPVVTVEYSSGGRATG